MIQITRTSAPDFFESEVLKEAKDQLKRNYRNDDHQGRFKFIHMRSTEILPAVLQMCNGKCSYCETLLTDNNIADIDHYRPKGGARGLFNDEYAPNHYWWLAYEWNNMLAACQTCNQKYKRDFFPLMSENLRSSIGSIGSKLDEEQPLLIDPTTEDPGTHLTFDSSSGLAIELTARGKATIELLGLNRLELVEKRIDAVRIFLSWLAVLEKKTTISRQKAIVSVMFIHEIFSSASQHEFTGMLRVVFDNWLDENEMLWENIKEISNDTSATIRQEKKDIEVSEAEAIEQLSHQVSNIKRFTIKSIEIENFKSIDHLKLEILQTSKNSSRESWLLLLGDNGIGKSSILQAITLALCGKEQLRKLDLDVMDYLRYGANSGKVIINSCESPDPVVLNFDSDGFVTDVMEAPTFLMSYGSTRLSPKGNILPDENKEPYVNVRNLFDYSTALCDPHKWLTSIDVDEFNNRIAPAFFDVLALNEGDRLWLNEGRININLYGRNRELEENSDAYKTVVALITDMMQTLTPDKGSYHNAQGIVMIDELGTHLHPKWKVQVVNALREAFPKLQFIVTSHEPLCLRGLLHGEVVVLVRDKKHNIRPLDHRLLPDHSLMRIDQLLTSDLFGLLNVMDTDAEKSYEEYLMLLSKEALTENEELKLKELSDIHVGKTILGSTPQEQIFFGYIEKTFAEKMREEGFKTVDELKKETVETIKNIVQNKNIDWL